MGTSQDEKAENHERIVAIASQRMRESGTDGPGVAEIMRAAGLTHGGFYKHFGSRDELVAEAVDHALTAGSQAAREVTENADDPLAAFVDWYASAEHCADPGHGCAVVALGADVPRAPDAVRASYSAQVERYITHLQELSGGDRKQAIAALTELVGGVLVARAVADPELSEEILATVRESLRTL